MTGRRGLGRLVALAAAAAAVLGGCGVPSSGGLQRIDPSTVPFGLLATAPPGSAEPRLRGPTTKVYLVRNERLATTARHVVGEAKAAEALRDLFVGPTTQETARGLTSDVPAQTRLISLDLNGPVATVDLSSEFATASGSEQVLAVAQIVYTLTASQFIDAVRFAINGKPIEVPDGSGSLSDQPRQRSDYTALAPG